MPIIGEYECRIDGKGRLRLPTQLIRQLNGGGIYNFVITRGFEKCLIMYEKSVWDEKVKQLENVNMFNKNQRKFVRHFLRSASVIGMDSGDRINLSASQMELAGIEKDAVLTSLYDRIEIWSKEEYEKAMDIDFEEYAELAEDVMGSSDELD